MEMDAFFVDQIRLNFDENYALISKMEEQEASLSPKLLRMMSHIINEHHIWNKKVEQSEPESDSWDELPLSYFESFNKQNAQESQKIIEDLQEVSDVTLRMDTFKKVQHILKHSVYHRGQIIHLMKEMQLQVPSTIFVYMVG